MNSSLFLLDVLAEDQAIQQSPNAVFKSHKQQAVTEEAERLSEPNTVDQLSWSRSIYDTFSHSTSCMFFGLLNTDQYCHVYSRTYVMRIIHKIKRRKTAF
jgi:hypothetical protein